MIRDNRVNGITVQTNTAVIRQNFHTFFPLKMIKFISGCWELSEFTCNVYELTELIFLGHFFRNHGNMAFLHFAMLHYPLCSVLG